MYDMTYALDIYIYILRGAVPGARRQTAATPKKNKSAAKFASTEATSAYNNRVPIRVFFTSGGATWH